MILKALGGVLATAAVLSACASTSETYPARTATEQLLVARAADRAVEGLTLPIPSGSRVYVDATFFQAENAAYAVSAIRAALSEAGYALAPSRAEAERSPEVELTFNWDPQPYDGGRNFGHLAYRVDDIYAACKRLMDGGVVVNRPPRAGRMAFVRSPDGISIELLQEGEALAPAEPWVSMPNTGVW